MKTIPLAPERIAAKLGYTKNVEVVPPRGLIGQASWLRPARSHQPEMLDLGLGSARDVEANLTEMWRINRFLGGFAALTRHLYPCLEASAAGFTLLDLGTGSAEIPVTIAHWARTRGMPARILAVDLALRNLRVAQRRVAAAPEVALLRADAGDLPLPPGEVDFVISSLFLHHLTPDQVVSLLWNTNRVARRAVIMSDLIRGWLPLAAFRLIQPILGRNYLTRHDGALSIRRAYTPRELADLAAEAGLENARVFTHWPWLMTLVAGPLAFPTRAKR